MAAPTHSLTLGCSYHPQPPLRRWAPARGQWACGVVQAGDRAEAVTRAPREQRVSERRGMMRAGKFHKRLTITSTGGLAPEAQRNPIMDGTETSICYLKETKLLVRFSNK
ncbi:hypothetical protein E2562_010193 [Oryza meyeriana var. granulata]|uniref:Uncharacterized protein n=1 Tax=Oryza meyeriana var. granulata TaxID=110450 RepID=A0A6G1EJG1_9ORYZ|nr:hypothetical protein E2562_010193 [Oryza meyeriana var. granulata]